MDTKPSEIIEAHGQHLKVSAWRGSDDVAQITPLTAFELLNSKSIEIGVQNARRMGYKIIYSNALMDHEIGGFLKCGFMVKEQLHILRHALGSSGSFHEMPRIKIRKPTRTELEDIVRLDKKCFDNFWTMDLDGLRGAAEATSRARFRAALYHQNSKTEITVGYAITGLGDKKGYLQRLAVDPEFQGRGIAQQLVEDGFEWLRFWRAHEEFVNTQTKNERALNFYLKMGFTLLSERLNVLELHLGS